jgi:methylated-DNA-[protein]-cysteine S-methyltransferase
VITPFLAPAPAPSASPASPGDPVRFDIVDSPIGRLLLTGDERALTGMYMMDTGGHPMRIEPGWSRDTDAFAHAAGQLREYFAGERAEFDLPLAPRGTPFQLAVWAELARIPYGKTASYGEVALALGKSLLASRAVGLANGRNPISIIVPCHRVIGADGSLTGYGGGLDRKEWLLRHEGVALSSAGPSSAGPSSAGRSSAALEGVAPARVALASAESQPTLW